MRIRPHHIGWGALLAGAVAIIVLFVLSNETQHPSAPSPAQVTVATTPAAPAGDLASQAPENAPPAGGSPAQSELRDETPPGVQPAALKDGKAETRILSGQANVSPTALPVGGAQGYSLTKDFSGHVYSDFYSSITPDEFCVHYTVSSNIRGWGDVRGTQSYFIRTKIGSATFIADFEAHVLQMTPLSKKAWTQGAFNPYCRASVEIIANGSETRADWLASPLIAHHVLANLMHDVMARYNIPPVFVNPVGCSAPAGWTDHNHIECGNDHFDVSPTCAFGNANNGHPLYPAFSPPGCSGFPFDVLEAQLRAAFGSTPCSARTACRMGRRHAAVHKAIAAKCHGKQARTHVKACRRLHNRNRYIHGYAHRHHLRLVTR